MNFSELSLEVTVALLGIVSIAFIGCITALYSWNRIATEQKGIRDAESKLISDNSWYDAYPQDKLLLATWLRSHGIKPDSHIGDFMRTCWSAWLGGRPASVTELHALVARRERSHKATRLSAGIAGLLLVFGIVGTLSAVKPVLEKFQIQVAEQSIDPNPNRAESNQPDLNLDEGTDAAFVAKNADKVNSLIRNLGGAFFPSLLALIGTICVVTCRGIYSHSLYKFTLELDRFAVDTLIPRYRVIPISEQFEGIKASMTQLTKTIIQRESNFENVVSKLGELVSKIAPSLAGLDGAAKANMEAVEALTKGSSSITDALNRHLGARSSIHRAIKDLDKTYTDVESWFKELARISETINNSNTASKKQLNDAIIALARFFNKSVQDFEVDREKIAGVINDLKNELTDIPDQIRTTGVNATKQAINTAETASQDLQKKFYERNSSFMEAVKTTITTEVRKFDKVSSNLSDQSTKIETSIRSLEDVKKDIKKSIEEVASAGVRELKDFAAKAPAQLPLGIANLPHAGKNQNSTDGPYGNDDVKLQDYDIKGTSVRISQIDGYTDTENSQDILTGKDPTNKEQSECVSNVETGKDSIDTVDLGMNPLGHSIDEVGQSGRVEFIEKIVTPEKEGSYPPISTVFAKPPQESKKSWFTTIFKR